MKTKNLKRKRKAPIGGSLKPDGSTRRSLMDWTLKGVTTDHLRRLKATGENICQMVARLRQEKQFLEFDLERLRTDHENLLGGHKRWREEAVNLHQVLVMLKRELDPHVSNKRKYELPRSAWEEAVRRVEANDQAEPRRRA